MQIVLWTIGIYFINTYNRIVLQMQRNRTQLLLQDNLSLLHVNKHSFRFYFVLEQDNEKQTKFG